MTDSITYHSSTLSASSGHQPFFCNIPSNSMGGCTDIQDLGSISEFIGSIGMIVSLAHLAIQVRQNTLTTKMQMIQDAATAQQQVILRLMDDDMAERAAKHSHGEAITEIENFKSSCWYIANLRRYESYPLQNERGLFDRDLRAAKSNLLKSWFESEDMKKAWQRPTG